MPSRSGSPRFAIWWAGVRLERAADEISRRTGLGQAFTGVLLLATATSLPEVATTVTAVAVLGDAFDASLLLLADVLHRDGTILAAAEGPVALMAAVGAAMTCIYLWGLAERQNRTVLRVGWDSAAAAALYLMAVVVLYFVQ
jgi:cation:H+ antiporter